MNIRVLCGQAQTQNLIEVLRLIVFVESGGDWHRILADGRGGLPGRR
jgi:hypothetical protein